MVIFDSGYRKGAVVSRCEEHGKELRDFRVYCPKVMVRIGNFKGTLLDRGILIHLTNAYGLPQTFLRVLKKEAVTLKRQLEAYAVQRRAALEDLYTAQPDETYWPELCGRESQLWNPLL